MSAFKNIDQLPPEIQGKVAQYSQKLLDIHNSNIVSIAVYGSACSINFVPKVSDINIAVVFQQLDFSVFQKSLKLAAQGRKEKITAPLFLTREYILNSLDVFPIEFSEIRDHHLTIFGEDLFSTINVDAKHVRLLCESQIKGKLLRIRQAYLEVDGNWRSLKHVLRDSLNSLFPVFRQLLVLTGQEPLTHKEEMLKQIAEKFSLNAAPLIAVYQDKNKIVALHPSQIEQLLNEYCAQLEQLAHRIDQL
jgi:hypothetical protein